MQKLHPVGFTAELDGLILSARKGAKTGRFVVPLDGKLLKLLAEAERGRERTPRAAQEPVAPRLVRPDSALTPREMQDRIRSGWTIEEVAAEAGVDLDWVRRFASPVFAELGRVIDRARQAVYDKPRFGLSSLPLGSSVRRNVLDRGVRLLDEELDECWSAYQLDDDVWVVRFVYTSRGRDQEAEWLYDMATEELSSRNRLGAQLGHVVRGRAKRPPDAPATPKPSATTKAAAKATKAAAAKVAASTDGASSSRPRAARKKAASRPAKKATKAKAHRATVVTVEVAPVPTPVSPTPPPRPRPTPRATTDDVTGEVAITPAPAPAPDVEIVHIDSRRSWRGAGSSLSSVERPRRTEPLRGR